MKNFGLLCLGSFVSVFSNAAYSGGGWTPSAVSVPVDSPLALLGLSLAIGLMAIRLFKNSR